MTVATDLKANTGTHIVGYLAIEGVQHLLFENSDLGPPTGWSRPIKVCLDQPASFANEVNLGEAAPQISAATFSLQDIKNSDGTSFFGKLFATGRWTFNPHARMEPGASFQSQVDANADFIPLKALGALSANSNGFITRESINWGDTNADGIQNVVKGQWPPVAIDSNYGYSYHRPPDDGRGYLPHVGSVGFAMNGRRVAYYITTYDRTTGAFNAQANSELIWTGRISNQVQWAGSEDGTWKVACDSLTSELSQKTPAAMSVGTLSRITLGSVGNSFRLFVHPGFGNKNWYQHHTVTVAAGGYTLDELLKEVNKQIQDPNNMTFRTTGGGVNYPGPLALIKFVQFQKGGGGYNYKQTSTGAAAPGTPGKTMISILTDYNHTDFTNDDLNGCSFVLSGDYEGKTSHLLGALGFVTRGRTLFSADYVASTNPAKYAAETESAQKYYSTYHPLHRDYNGSKLFVKDADIFWEDQGDAATSQACVKVDDTTLAPFWNLKNKEGTYYARYSARTTTGANFLTLTTNPQDVVSADGFVGQSYGKDPVEVQQVYIPHYKPNVNGTGSPRGPFELLLYPLLSTGTSGYNHATYDKCPLDLGLAVQKELVDIQSFKQADKYALSQPIGHRKLYAITKPISWLELVQRECKLFGYILVWRKGKLRLRPVLHSPGVDGWTNTLSDSTRANPEEVPTVVMSTDTIVNQYSCRLRYDVRQDKFGPPITITDVDSALAQGVKQVKIDHQGVDFGTNNLVNAKKMLDTSLLERWIRFPLPTLTQSLVPTLVNEIFAGDIVKYTSSLIPDPYGSGTMTTSTLATVLSSTWDFREGTGECLLMLHDRALASAWAPAAAVNIAAPNGGLHNAQNQIQLIPYTFTSNTSIFTDGNAVGEHSGWAVQVFERSPVDPTSPNTFGPWNTVNGYFTSNHTIQVPPDDFAGWDTTGNTEYFMTFANAAVINVTQLNDGKGTWQANADTELLFGANVAQVYK